MAHTYIRLDFGGDEGKAQEACHKLDVWKQTARLDKKLLYKLEREEVGGAEGAAAASTSTQGTSPAEVKDEKAEKAGKTEKPSQPEKGKGKGQAKAGQGKAEKAAAHDAKSEKAAAAEAKPEKSAMPAGKLTLFVRLYFSSHEKLSEQRWIDRIPTEEPFKNAAPKIIRKGDAEFEEADEQFTEQELGSKRAR